MSEQSDVVIIGGGVIGLCAAHYLSASGVTVTLLESRKVGAACSDKNAGLVVPSHIIPLAAPGVIKKGLQWMLRPDSPFYIRPRFNLELLTWLWKFSRACSHDQMRHSMPVLNEMLHASSALFDGFSTASDNAFGLTRRGLLMLYKTEKALQAETRDADAARDLGQEVNVLRNSELEALEPNIRMSAAGGIHYVRDAHLDPEAFVRTVHTRLDKKLVRIEERTEVHGFESQGNHISAVQTSHGRIAGKEFVLAAGAWSPVLSKALGIKLPMQAGKGYSVTVSNLVEKPRLPFILAEAKVAVTPIGESFRFAGTMELSGLNEHISRRRVQAILKAVPAYFPSLDTHKAETRQAWTGLRPCTPDGLPYIGRFTRVKNLVAATGHAMLGISLAPFTGKLVSEIVQHKKPSVKLSPLSPERFE